MSKLTGTVPPEHILPELLPSVLTDTVSAFELTAGWLFQSRPEPVPLVHLAVTFWELWPHESHADQTSEIFSVECRTLKLELRALMLKTKKVRIAPMQEVKSL